MEESLYSQQSQILLQAFRRWTEAVFSTKPEAVKEIQLPGARSEWSMAGVFRDIPEMLDALAWRGPVIKIKKQRLCNFAVMYDSAGKRARQSACLMSAYGTEHGDSMDFYQYGGHFSNRWVRLGEKWTLEDIRFEMDWDFGNTAFAPSWAAVDYETGWRPSFHPLAVMSEEDSPFRMEDGLLNDYEPERAVSAFYQYAYGMDNSDFYLLYDSLAPDVVIDMPPFGESMNRRYFLSVIKTIRGAETRFQHAVDIDSLKIDGESAVLKANRIEPNRISPYVLSRENFDTVFYTARYEIELRKTGERWKIRRLRYRPGIFTKE